MGRHVASIGFLGPHGTFTEEALLTQADWSGAELRALTTEDEVMAAVAGGEVDLGFLPMENAIEGTVNATMDGLVFRHDLVIQREVVLDIHLNLLAAPGTTVEGITSVASHPHASAQCRQFLADRLPGAEVVAANSTAEAARRVGLDRRPSMAALAPALAARAYDLEVLVSSVEDHPNNQTRFVAVGTDGIPAPTGHDRTSIVCFEDADRPGYLHSILGQFAARGINLSKLESRPTKRGLGEYCFIIDLEGHIGDELVADCLRELYVELAGMRFLGSYPAAGESGPAIRRETREAWRAAEDWMASLRSSIGDR